MHMYQGSETEQILLHYFGCLIRQVGIQAPDNQYLSCEKTEKSNPVSGKDTPIFRNTENDEISHHTNQNHLKQWFLVSKYQLWHDNQGKNQVEADKCHSALIEQQTEHQADTRCYKGK